MIIKYIAQNIDEKWGIGFSLNTIGEAHRNLGDYEKSTEVLEKCLVIRKKIGNKELQIIFVSCSTLELHLNLTVSMQSIESVQ